MTIENTILTRVNDSNNYNKQLENLKSKLKVKCKRKAEQTRTYKIFTGAMEGAYFADRSNPPCALCIWREKQKNM